MPSIQIRSFSEEAYKKLVMRAKQDKRSIQQEAAWLLESALLAGTCSPFTMPLHQPDWTAVDQIREDMKKRYGTQPDSTPLIREMRDER